VWSRTIFYVVNERAPNFAWMRDPQESPVTTGVAIMAPEMIGHTAAGFAHWRKCGAEATKRV
jgi:hypothetical protein